MGTRKQYNLQFNQHEYHIREITSISSYTNTDDEGDNSEGNLVKEISSKSEGTDVHLEDLQKWEKQAKLKTITRDVLLSNNHLLVRPYFLTCKEQNRLFGHPVEATAEVLTEDGERVMLVGRRTFWKPRFAIIDPPAEKDLQRYFFIAPGGGLLFHCTVRLNSMSINLSDKYLGKLVFHHHRDCSCEDWDSRVLIAENSNGDEEYRIARAKNHFAVLQYPEQDNVCNISSQCDGKDFPFLGSQRCIFGIPFAKDLKFDNRALLFTSGYYIYDNYYQRSRFSFFALWTFVTVCAVAIFHWLTCYKLGWLIPDVV